MILELHGYHYSVYTRIARVALAEKGLTHRHVEVDPFAEAVSEGYLAMNPFQRVPTLVDGDFVLYETAAITRYIDEAFDGPALQPATAALRARMQQIVGVIDSYGYWPMVRQVFSHRVFRPHLGQAVDEDAVRRGLQASATVLRALEDLAGDGPWLLGEQLTLADIHLAPMMAYFAPAPEGGALLADFARLSGWWSRVAARPSMVRSAPGLPEVGG
ncbi:MAG: glutathione S-transferase family protein [Caulobacter sp.]|nr:glutathione S-transferase family protein [Caulobacter sp.]